MSSDPCCLLFYVGAGFLIYRRISFHLYLEPGVYIFVACKQVFSMLFFIDRFDTDISCNHTINYVFLRSTTLLLFFFPLSSVVVLLLRSLRKAIPTNNGFLDVIE